jgi:hypothetical protein
MVCRLLVGEGNKERCEQSTEKSIARGQSEVRSLSGRGDAGITLLSRAGPGQPPYHSDKQIPSPPS